VQLFSSKRHDRNEPRGDMDDEGADIGRQGVVRNILFVEGWSIVRKKRERNSIHTDPNSAF
jgi:hypothetical protein